VYCAGQLWQRYAPAVIISIPHGMSQHNAAVGAASGDPPPLSHTLSHDGHNCFTTVTTATVVLLLLLQSGKPFFGICLGLQLLFEGSDESGGCEGLGIIKGKVCVWGGGVSGTGVYEGDREGGLLLGALGIASAGVRWSMAGSSCRS
jgi:hypothetical protein